MAYERHEWKCGETITADLLNNLEGGVQEALAGGGGFSCTETRETLINENVTTTVSGSRPFALGRMSEAVPYDTTIVVTFNGVEYTCEYEYDDDGYGAPWDSSLNHYDWSKFPFSISGDNLRTETAGTYSVKIETSIESVTYTDCFYKAVKKAVEEMNTIWIDATGEAHLCGDETESAFCGGTFYLQISKSEAEAYASAGKIVRVHDKRTISSGCANTTDTGGNLEGKIAEIDVADNIITCGDVSWPYDSNEDKYYHIISCPY